MQPLAGNRDIAIAERILAQATVKAIDTSNRRAAEEIRRLFGHYRNAAVTKAK